MTVAFAEPDPGGNNAAPRVQSDEYHAADTGPSTTSYQKEYRTSFQTHGGSFTTRNVTQGHLAGYSGQSRSSLVNWDAGATSTPSFNS